MGVSKQSDPEESERKNQQKIKAEINELQNQNTEINKRVQEPILFLNKVAKPGGFIWEWKE